MFVLSCFVCLSVSPRVFACECACVRVFVFVVQVCLRCTPLAHQVVPQALEQAVHLSATSA